RQRRALPRHVAPRTDAGDAVAVEREIAVVVVHIRLRRIDGEWIGNRRKDPAAKQFHARILRRPGRKDGVCDTPIVDGDADRTTHARMASNPNSRTALLAARWRPARNANKRGLARSLRRSTRLSHSDHRA